MGTYQSICICSCPAVTPTSPVSGDANRHLMLVNFPTIWKPPFDQPQGYAKQPARGKYHMPHRYIADLVPLRVSVAYRLITATTATSYESRIFTSQHHAQSKLLTAPVACFRQAEFTSNPLGSFLTPTPAPASVSQLRCSLPCWWVGADLSISKLRLGFHGYPPTLLTAPLPVLLAT